MQDITKALEALLREAGAAKVGFGRLDSVPGELRRHLPVGVSVAVLIPGHVVRDIARMPTMEYHEQYGILNQRLDDIVTVGETFLRELGYQAVANTREAVREGMTEFATILPHKTVATRAGVGWIGKCALLVTAEYGSMIRLSSLLTDAPLETGEPINESKCGACTVCKDGCPAGAVSGKLWHISMPRDEFWDAGRCKETALMRSFESYGIKETLCGKCIAICPYTKRYLDGGLQAEKNAVGNG